MTAPDVPACEQKRATPVLHSGINGHEHMKGEPLPGAYLQTDLRASLFFDQDA
ncbi:hypothetical protein BN2476_1010018 [Paraburkholderia piptadeniae]|uniref:Uncharacterized protein n=1 Tax=Paraburkholderia piptadeniae TaxID=1701573 RepID=A0A1N7SUU8_9BURK|nr:hypothetical protein BN2476_1010018 [Paraburkholderia piptadeniae]